MAVTGSALDAALDVLEHPRWIALAAAGFLVRGGFLVLLLPIVPIPTTAGLANLVGPTLVGFVFGGVSPTFLILVLTAAGGLVAWLVLGAYVGGAIDLGLIREAALSEDRASTLSGAGPAPATAAIARLGAHLPTLAAIVVGAAPLVDAAYQELIHPGDPTLSVPIRVVLRVPGVVGMLLIAWALGEAIGGLALRHLALGARMPGAWLRAVRTLVHPIALVVLLATDAVVLVAAGLGWLLLGASYDLIRSLAGGGEAAVVLVLGIGVVTIAVLATIWLLGVATAWRSAAWTRLVARFEPRTIE
jgi:hypothetical protein